MSCHVELTHSEGVGFSVPSVTDCYSMYYNVYVITLFHHHHFIYSIHIMQ